MELKICASKTCSLYAIEDKYCRSCKQLNRDKPVKVDKGNAYGFKNQIELFRYKWDNSPHRCFVTGQRLDKFNGTPYFVSIFAHVLRKSKFPEIRLDPNNIVLLSPKFKDYSVHHLFDNGTVEEIRKFENLSGKSLDILFEFERGSLHRYNQEYGKSSPERKLVSNVLG